MIGFHGQTVLHRPQSGVTVQLGDGAAAGGGDRPAGRLRHARQRHEGRRAGRAAGACLSCGAGPLAPGAYAGSLSGRFRQYRRHLEHHLCRRGDPIAFDTGPGNALIDQWVAREGGVPFDADGAIASEGGVVRRSSSAISTIRFSEDAAEIARPQRFHAGRSRRAGTCRRRAHAGRRFGRSDPESVEHLPERQSSGSSAAAGARTRTSSMT